VNLKKIASFIDAHHVLSLATTDNEELSVCNLFYIYDARAISFIVASSEDTTHIKHIQQQNKVAGSIVLETKRIGKIQGLQFRGSVIPLEDAQRAKLYFKAFPPAVVMQPKLWEIGIECFKFTDNTLGFGKKLIWQRA